MPITITLLKPASSKSNTAKQYHIVDGKPKCVKDYDLATYFTHKEGKVKDLQHFYKILKSCADERYFRIAGTLNLDGEAELLTTGVVKRRNEFFDDMGTQILCFDADDWLVPQGFSLRTPGGIRKTVQHMLVHDLGFKFLDGVQFIVLMSSSFFDGRVLNAHIYFLIDGPVSVVVLREWYNALLLSKPKHKLDPALFRQCQPDYISKRLCVGFPDPLQDDLRLTIHCDSLSPYVSKAGLLKHIDNDVAVYGDAAIQNVATTGVVSSYKGEKWEDTLANCGGVWGINEVLVTTAGQLVAQVGNNDVTANLSFYIGKMLKGASEAMAKNKDRNTPKDRKRYLNAPKIKNYLMTALSKKYGVRADEKQNTVNTAIDAVIAGGAKTLLYDSDVLEAAKFIRDKQPGKWVGLKDRLTNIKEWASFEKAVKGAGKDSKLDMSQIINNVIQQNTWVRGTNTGEEYCKVGNEDSYQLLQSANGLGAHLFNNVLDMTGSPPQNIEKNVMKVVDARAIRKETDPYVEHTVATRVYSEMKGDKYVVYYNCGRDELGYSTTCVVTEDGYKVIPSPACPILWATDVKAPPALVDSMDDYVAVFGDDTAKELKDMYIQGMREFSSAEDKEAFADIVAWQVTQLTGGPILPVLELTGDHSSGKSTTSALCKDLIDPSSRDLGTPDHQLQLPSKDLAVIVRGTHITAFDNQKNLTPHQQNMLCTVSSGMVDKRRELYSDRRVEVQIKKGIIITGLNPLVTQTDLLSRTLTVQIDRRMRTLGGDILDQWNTRVSTLRAGLMLVTSEVLKRIGEKRRRGESINDRRIWVTEAQAVAYKLLGIAKSDHQAVAMLNARRVREDTEEALINSRASQYIAWLLYDDGLQDKEVYTLTSGALFRMFKEFLTSKSGIEVYHIAGQDVEITTSHMPQTIKSFTSGIRAHNDAIETITGWRWETVWVNRKRGRALKRDKPLKDCVKP